MIRFLLEGKQQQCEDSCCDECAFGICKTAGGCGAKRKSGALASLSAFLFYMNRVVWYGSVSKKLEYNIQNIHKNQLKYKKQ